MTMTENPQRERAQHDQAAQANQAHAAEQRQAAAHVSHAVAVARSERTRAAHLGADTRRLEVAFAILSEQINGREDMTTLRPGNVLRHGPGGPEQGTANVAALCEFVARVTDGELPYDVIEEMHADRLERHLAPAVGHAQSMYLRADRLEQASTVPAALPPGQPELNGSLPPLPRRTPGATIGPQPSQPPMFPPAPPESPAEQTGAIFSRLRENGHDIPAEIERAARKDHGTSLETRTPDPAFGAASVRIGDMQPMRMDEVLGHLAQADAGKDDEAVEEHGGRLVPPFVPAAVEAGDASRSDAASGSAGDGDVEA